MSDVYRQSALLLHSVGEADRAWVLQRLEPEQRADLGGYLQELTELGLPADPFLVDSLLQQRDIETPPENQDVPVLPWHTLRTASGPQMLHLLRTEPSWLIGTILSIEAWPWREAIFVGLDTSRRDRVRSAMRETVSARLATSLCTELEARVSVAQAEGGLHSSGVFQREAGLGSRLIEKVRSWF